MADINYFGSISLGKIQNWSAKKVGKLTPITFPGKDSGKVEAIDTLGVYEMYDFSGRWTGSFGTIQSYIAGIKTILDGQQTSAQELKSPFINARDINDSFRVGLLSSTTDINTNKLIDTNGAFVNKGIQAGDLVKNLVSGAVAEVSTVDDASNITLTSYGGGASDIFTNVGDSYALTATINSKILSINIKWNLPGLSYCDYQISLIQVA